MQILQAKRPVTGNIKEIGTTIINDHMKSYKTLNILSVLVAAMLLASCTEVVSEAETSGTEIIETSETTVTETSAAETEGIFDLALVDDEYAWQLQVILDNEDVWVASEEDSIDADWYCLYAITDLDNDGLLEVCKRAVYSNGPVTRLWMYEVTDERTIVRLESEVDDGLDYVSSNYPDFEHNEPIEFYQAEDGTYYYLVYDCKSYGLTSVYNNYGLMALVDNVVTINEVCYEHSEDADEIITFYDGSGNEISEEEYDQLFEEYEGLATGEVYLVWFYEPSMDNLIESWWNWNENDLQSVILTPTPTPEEEDYISYYLENPQRYGDYVDSVEDGLYYGELCAVSEDGTQALISIGYPVTITREEYDALEIGDVITIPPYCEGESETYLEVVDFFENGDYRRPVFDEDYYAFGSNYSFDGNNEESDEPLMLYLPSYNPELYGVRCCFVPIASDCEVTDMLAPFFPENVVDGYTSWSTDVPENSMTTSFFWYALSEIEKPDTEPVDGWLPYRALAYPVVIENGEITSINLEWR